jgi:hypothetical protein
MRGLVGTAMLAAVVAMMSPAHARQRGQPVQNLHQLDLTTMLPAERMAALSAGRTAARQPLRQHSARRGANRAHGAASHDSGGIIRSGKTGATARVAARHRAVFQAYIDAVEATGARLLFIGGVRRGHCKPGSQHPCGMAIDLCQIRRGVVDRRCKLPRPAALAGIAARHGLSEGAVWCASPDYGHAQIQRTGSTCQAVAGPTRKRHYALDGHL